MNRVAVPDETFAVPIGRVKDVLELLDSLLRPAEAKDALNFSGFNVMLVLTHPVTKARLSSIPITVHDGTRTSLLQENTTFCYHDRHITIDVALAVLVDERDGDVGIRNALPEGNTKDALGTGLVCDY